MSSADINCEYRVLQENQKILVSSLKETDLVKLSMELFKSIVIPKEVKDKFASLDHHQVDFRSKARYLLKHTIDRVKKDRMVYYRLIEVLEEVGNLKKVCMYLNEELDQDDSTSVLDDQASDEACTSKVVVGSKRPRKYNICLSEQDVSILTELLAPYSHKWEEIGIALGLPKHAREECRDGSNVVSLSNILRMWITGVYDGPAIVTLDKLRYALASKLVGEGRAMLNLNEKFNSFTKRTSASMVKQPRVDAILEMVYQSCDTKVAEGKSTILEVQVNSTELVSYQWVKDGQSLSDNHIYHGVYSDILFIYLAAKVVEGKYVCHCSVSTDSESIKNEEIKVSVNYSPEKKYLVEFYSVEVQEVSEDSWPPVNSFTYVNLVLIKKYKLKNSDYNYTVRGDMDDILECKEKISYTQVFKKYETGALVLLEGRPGSGKTTLVHKVTKDWAAGKNVLMNTNLVFLIPLRILNSSRKDATLVDVFELFYDDGDRCRAVIADMERSGGKGVCFILDGLDEYQSASRDETVIHRLIYKKYLRFAMVIVTSRPVATVELRRQAAKRIEVLGFSKPQIYEYVDKYPFDSSNKKKSRGGDMAAKLKGYLDAYSNVLHMCYLPIHAAIICFLYNEYGNIPRTETQIYELFTRSTLLRKLKRTDKRVKLKSLKELSGDNKEYFDGICKLAFDMTISSKQVVYQSDAEIFPTHCTGSDVASLGLLTIDSTARDFGMEDLYAFLHLTLQEYLAAVYIAGLDEEEQIKALHLCKYSQNTVVLKFYCGMVKFDTKVAQLEEVLNSEGMGDLHKVQCAFESQQRIVCDGVVQFGETGVLSFQNNALSASDFVAIGYVISTSSHCVQKIAFSMCEINEEGVRAFMTEVGSQRLKSVKCLCFTDRDEWGCTLNEFELLNSLLRKLPSLEVLNLLRIRVNKVAVELLTKNCILPMLKIIKIHIPLEPCSQPEEVLKLLSFGSSVIDEVYFSQSSSVSLPVSSWKKYLQFAFGFEMSSVPFFPYVILHNSSENVSSINPDHFLLCKVLVLVNCGIDDSGATILARSLKNSSSLEDLELDYNRISDSGVQALAGTLATCSKIEVISLQCNLIGDSGARTLLDELVHSNSLRELDLQGNAISDEGAIAIAKAAKYFPKLELYLFNFNITEEGIKKILEHNDSVIVELQMGSPSSWDFIKCAGIGALRNAMKCGGFPYLELSRTSISVDDIKMLVSEFKQLRYLQALELADNDIDTDGATTLAGILNSFCNLEELDISRNSIGVDGAVALADGLGPSLQTLNMSKNSIGLDGTAALADRLKYCNNLQDLQLSSVGIGSEGAVMLADGLKFCPGLKMLSLSKNDIDLEGAKALANGLNLCHNMELLDLSDNDIGSNGGAALLESLKCCKNLQTLDFRKNDIGTSSIAPFADGLKPFSSLQTLYLSGNDIDSNDAATLVSGLKFCKNLQLLDVAFNDLGSDGIAVLASGLSCDNLHTLDISGCSIDSEGAAALIHLLALFDDLQELDVSNNFLDSDGAASLAKGLESCSSLQKLNLSQNRIIDPEVAATLYDSLKFCTKLRELDISSNDVGSGAAALAHGLKSCNSLQKLVLLDSNIRSDSIRTLFDGLKNCKDLQTLELCENNIGSDCARAIVDGLQFCKNLQTLDLSGSIDPDCEAALVKGEKCCSNCDILQTFNYSHNSLSIKVADSVIPNLLSARGNCAP